MRKTAEGTRQSILRMWTQGVNKSHISRAVGVTWQTTNSIIKEWQKGPGKGFVRRPLDPVLEQADKDDDKESNDESKDTSQ